jgi:hypothetical protein
VADDEAEFEVGDGGHGGFDADVVQVRHLVHASG